MKTKIYAVAIGRKPGIYMTWSEAADQVDGFPGAVHRSFASAQQQDAAAWLQEKRTDKHAGDAAQHVASPSIHHKPPAQSDRDVSMRRLPSAAPTGLILDRKLSKHALPSDAFLSTMTPTEIFQPTKNTAKIFADGSCRGNPGKGGFCAVLATDEQILEISAGFSVTTNNRMELLGILEAFRCLRQLPERSRVTSIEIHCDSRYVIDGLERWSFAWAKRNWMRAADEPVKNADLWKAVHQQRHGLAIKYFHVDGHIQNLPNIFCDFRAVQCACFGPHADDVGFLQPEVPLQNGPKLRLPTASSAFKPSSSTKH